MVWKATHEWEKTHLKGEDWQVIGEVKHRKNGLPMALLFNGDDPRPWCVQFAGSGHYFKTRAEAEAWAEERLGRA